MRLHCAGLQFVNGKIFTLVPSGHGLYGFITTVRYHDNNVVECNIAFKEITIVHFFPSIRVAYCKSNATGQKSGFCHTTPL